MGFKLKLIALVIILIFTFPQTARASSREFIARFEMQDGVNRLIYDDLYFVGEFSSAERAWIVFYNLLSSGESWFVPANVELLEISIENGEMIINLSQHIKNYGGNYNEKHLRAQIVLTGLQMQGVDAVTLLIEGEPAVLPEGSHIYRMNEWDELMD